MALDALRSGFVQLCISPALNYYEDGASVLIEGQLPDDTHKGTTPAVAETLYKIAAPAQAEALFGPDTVMTAAIQKAFCAAPSGVTIYAVAHTPSVSNVAAVYTMTFTGTATSDGTIQIFMLDGAYNIDVDVATGDSVTAIAANTAAAINALDTFPYTAVAALGVVTLTAVDKGACGNYLNPVYNWTGNAGVAPVGVSMAVTRTVSGSGSWTPGNYSSILGECCYDAYALLTEDTAVQKALISWLNSNWGCDKPQCFGQGYTYNVGTLGQVLATGSNAAFLSRLAYPVNDVNPPWLIVAEYAAKSAQTVYRSQPQIAIQGETYGVCSCISRPNSCSQPWSLSARKQLSAAGFVTYGPATMGGLQLAHPMIYEDITNYLRDAEGRPNVTYRSSNTLRWAKAFSSVLADFLETSFDGLAFFTSGTAIKPGVQATTESLAYGKIVNQMNDWEGVLISQIVDASKQIVLQSSFDVEQPCQGTPGLYYLKLIVGPPIRAANFVTTVLPKLLDNCNRAA